MQLDSATVSIPSEAFSARPIVKTAGGESTVKRSATATEDRAIRSVCCKFHFFTFYVTNFHQLLQVKSPTNSTNHSKNLRINLRLLK